jgi:hypothetical protein
MRDIVQLAREKLAVSFFEKACATGEGEYGRQLTLEVVLSRCCPSLSTILVTPSLLRPFCRCPGAQAPLIQPGAPGQASRTLEGKEAVALLTTDIR